MSKGCLDLLLASSIPKVSHLETFRCFWDAYEPPIVFIFKKADYPTPYNVHEFLRELMKIYNPGLWWTRGDLYTSPGQKFWIYREEIIAEKNKRHVMEHFVTVFVLRGENNELGQELTNNFLDYLTSNLRSLVVVDIGFITPRQKCISCIDKDKYSVIYFAMGWENAFQKDHELNAKLSVEKFFNLHLTKEAMKHIPLDIVDNEHSDIDASL